MQQKIVIALDNTHVFPVQLTGHVGVFADTMELDVPIQYMSWSSHKLATTVLHRGQAVAQDGHDCGMLIVHMCLTMPWLSPVFIAKSDRKISFSAMDVLVENVPVGFGLLGGSSPTPMVPCGLLPLPIGDADTSAGNGVVVGMDPLWDYGLCWGGVLVNIVVEAVKTVRSIASMGTADAAETAVEELADLLGIKEAISPPIVDDPGAGVVDIVRSLRRGDSGDVGSAVLRQVRPPIAQPSPTWQSI